MRILVVEDDTRLSSFIRRGLREQHYTVDVAKDGEEALFLAQTETYDLIVLDLVLPKRTGIDVIRTLRGDRVTIPILILTGRDRLQDKVDGLDAGADDYLTKPFGFAELLARVRALLRRRSDMVPTVLRLADLELDTLRHKAKRSDKPLRLTSREYALLEFFMRNANQLVTRTTLAEHVWEQDFDPLSNVIDVHIARLRHKIDEDYAVKLLKTVRGSGYILQDPSVPESAAAEASEKPGRAVLPS